MAVCVRVTGSGVRRRSPRSRHEHRLACSDAEPTVSDSSDRAVYLLAQGGRRLPIDPAHTLSSHCVPTVAVCTSRPRWWQSSRSSSIPVPPGSSTGAPRLPDATAATNHPPGVLAGTPGGAPRAALCDEPDRGFRSDVGGDCLTPLLLFSPPSSAASKPSLPVVSHPPVATLLMRTESCGFGHVALAEREGEAAVWPP